MRARNFHDLTGQKFGRLTVQSLSQEPRKSDTKWICICDCGEIVPVGAQNLKRDVAKSCGCLKREASTTHGLSRTQEHRIWRGIMDRCHSVSYSKSKPKVWSRYGGRGIVVALEWHDFSRFYKDMGPRPCSDMTVERLDNNGPYASWNCCWETRKAQGRNRRDNRLLDYEGRKITLGEIIELMGSVVQYSVANSRVNDGWDWRDAISYPLKKHRPRGSRSPKCAAAWPRVRRKPRTNQAP